MLACGQLQISGKYTSCPDAAEVDQGASGSQCASITQHDDLSKHLEEDQRKLFLMDLPRNEQSSLLALKRHTDCMERLQN
jgi:hypothetical protein